jgi:type VI secretion protein, VC_A0114 family
MSWYSKVVWSEGLFLRQHHLQQHDRYVEHLLDLRTRYITPYPWGFTHLEIDRDLAQQNKFGLRRAGGVFQDGTPFDLGDGSPLPHPVDVPEGSERRYVYLTLPGITPNMREVDMEEGKSGSRYTRSLERVIDSSAAMHLEEEIEVGHPRVEITISEVPKPGYNNLLISRIVEVRDKTIILDETIAPPVLVCHAHPVPMGWLDRVIGWVETRLESLSRYATDPSSGGGLQAYDYFMLQMLNREINVLKHYRASKYVHPETLYVEILRLAGELSTFSGNRLVAEFPKYDHDNLRDVFDPILNTIQRLLSLDIGRAIRLELTEVRANAFIANVTDRSLFRNARFIIEVAASMPLSQIQLQFPDLVKVGPNTKMKEIVQTHLPGIAVIHMPTPPRQIRTITDHVYFQLEKNSPLWPEFSVASGLAMHFAGNWPDLQLELWAIVDD